LDRLSAVIECSGERDEQNTRSLRPTPTPNAQDRRALGAPYSRGGEYARSLTAIGMTILIWRMQAKTAYKVF
jgi:hypothetical protein